MTDEEVELISTEAAVAEVRRWLEVEGVDPETVFTACGDRVIRYKDLIAHLEAGTPDGELLRFAISRGRLIRRPPRAAETLLQISGARPVVPRTPEDGDDDPDDS